MAGGINNLIKVYKMKKLIIISMFSLTACATNFPEVGTGITIKPLKELNENAYKKFIAHKKLFNDYTPEQSDSNDARLIKDNVELIGVDLYTYNLSDNQHDTEIRKSVNQLKLGFKFKPIKDNDLIYTTGFAPMGQYNKSGWSGVTQYFRHYKIGHCVFEKTNYDTNHGAIWLPKERVSNTVKGHTTMIYNYGSKDNGYNYTVNWYEDKFINTLRCANVKSSNEVALNVIELAKDISN